MQKAQGYSAMPWKHVHVHHMLGHSSVGVVCEVLKGVDACFAASCRAQWEVLWRQR
jgi:hypothetical protein